MWLVEKPGLGLYPVEVLVWKLLHIRVVLFYSRRHAVALQAGRSRVRFPIVSFHWHNPSGCTVALGLTQSLTEMSTRNISRGKGGRCVRLTTLPPSCTDCLEMWKPQLPGTLRACNAISLPLLFYSKLLKDFLSESLHYENLIWEPISAANLHLSTLCHWSNLLGSCCSALLSFKVTVTWDINVS